MAITVSLPQDFERRLRAEWPELERRTLEALLTEAFRNGKISSFEVGQILGFQDRWDAIHFLSEREVYPGEDIEQLEAGRCTFEKLAGKS